MIAAIPSSESVPPDDHPTLAAEVRKARVAILRGANACLIQQSGFCLQKTLVWQLCWVAGYSAAEQADHFHCMYASDTALA